MRSLLLWARSPTLRTMPSHIEHAPYHASERALLPILSPLSYAGSEIGHREPQLLVCNFCRALGRSSSTAMIAALLGEGV